MHYGAPVSLPWFIDVSRLDDLFADLPTHLSVDQLADVLGMKRVTVYRYLQRGILPAYKVEGSWVILRDEVKDYLWSHRNRPEQAADEPASEAED
jgi:excisionase family DNA binding protein